jgi:hypothetical protein
MSLFQLSKTKKRSILLFLPVLVLGILLQGAKPLSFVVTDSDDSTKPSGAHLVQGDNIVTRADGFALLLLSPFKSILVTQLSCTNLTVKTLRYVGNNISNKLVYRDVFGCPSKSRVDISSSFVSKKSKIEVDLGKTRLSLNGTRITILRDDVLATVGSSQGNVSSGGVVVSPGYFSLIQQDGILSKPQRAPTPGFTSVGYNNNQVTGCTYYFNNLVSQRKARYFYSEESICILTGLSDEVTITNPIGISQRYRWRLVPKAL